MLDWLKLLMSASLAFIATWAAAIGYWRTNNRVPATDDLVLYLLVLPLALLLVFWLGRAIYRRLSAGPAALAGAAALSGAAAPAAAALPQTAAPGLPIVAAAVRAPHGMSAEELRAALAEKNARPALDPELCDDHGFPVMSARMDAVGVDLLREEMTQWLDQQGMRDVHFNDEQWRALNAGHAVLAELAGYLSAHPQLAEHASRTDKRVPSPLPLLQLQTLWPDDWQAVHRQAVQPWFRQLIVQAGWPQERIAADEDYGSADASISGVLARLLGNGEAPSLALVLAFGSHIGSDSIDRMSGSATLFGASRQQGQIPGEGAAGLLLADVHQASLLDVDHAALPVLRAVGSGQLDSSADVAKRANAALLCELTGKALRSAHCEPAAIALVAADTDHRGSRVMELMGVLTEAMPQLDPQADVISIGAGCGSCGAVTYLTALALGRQEAQERNAAVLCLSNLDPYRREVAVIGPALA